MNEKVYTIGNWSTLMPTDLSCEGLKRAADTWGGCQPSLYRGGMNGEIYLSGCDDSTDEPILYCPYCGRLFEVEAREAT